MKLRYLVISLVVGMLIMMSISATACSPKTSQLSDSDTAEQDQGDAGEINADDNNANEDANDQSSDSSSDEVGYSGTDPEETINKLCSQQGCHSAAMVLGYTASQEAIRDKMSTHAMENGQLTQEQVDSLTEYFINK
ncbi:MAG: hypothetical protein LBK67_12225 [Coriobacteriales bacterium]|nr:hypothetical protein [Coriobacteriales bacterium]